MQTTTRPSLGRLFVAVTTLALLLMPVEYRAGADHSHPHATFQLWAEAAHGSPLHHHGDSSRDRGSVKQVDRHDHDSPQRAAPSVTPSGVSSSRWLSESPPEHRTASQTAGTTALTGLPPLRSLTVAEDPDVPTVSELMPAIGAHTAAIVGTPIVAFLLPLVCSVPRLRIALTLTGHALWPEPPPPRLPAALYS